MKSHEDTFLLFLLVQFSCVKLILMLSLHPRQTLEMGEGECIVWVKVGVFKGVV